MKYTVIDMECPGLNPDRLWCICATEIVEGTEVASYSFTEEEEMREYLLKQECLVGHNIKRFDIPVIERVLDIDLSKIRQIDTLGISWYLYPNRDTHNLEDWGTELGVEKPKIDNWENLSIQEYVHRCSEDVKINVLLFRQQMRYLWSIYNGDEYQVTRIMGYLSYKLECAAEQEQVRWRLDIPKAESNLAFLTQEEESKKEALRLAMPKVNKYREVSKPAKMYKKDGEVSSIGQRWLNYLEELNLPDSHEEPIRLLVGEEEANPESHHQIKAWLFSLGWIPETFDFKKKIDENGNEYIKKVPQTSLPNSGGICPSVLRVIEAHPEVAPLEGLFVARHRKTLITNFLKYVSEDGYLKAEISGFTNTLRFIHANPLVNLPTIHRKYGAMVRECLIAPEGYILCGSDMSALENNTKLHYIWNYDPDYVRELSDPEYDAHLDVAVLGSMLTLEQAEGHKLYKKTEGKEGESQDAIRNISKKGSFACLYGAGPTKISLSTNISMQQATAIHVAYWKKNWSVKKIGQDAPKKKVNGQIWVYNSISQFWYTLRYEKDSFSTINQSSGVYCFDTQIRHVRNKGVKICGQFHDEIVFPCLLGTEEEVRVKLNQSIEETNQELQLNIKLGISVQFGLNYSLIH